MIRVYHKPGKLVMILQEISYTILMRGKLGNEVGAQLHISRRGVGFLCTGIGHIPLG